MILEIFQNICFKTSKLNYLSLWKANDYDCDFHQILWMETQGNIGEALKTINYSMREAGW